MKLTSLIPDTHRPDALHRGLERVVVVCMVAAAWSSAHFAKGPVSLFYQGDYLTFVATLLVLVVCIAAAWRRRVGFREIFGVHTALVAFCVIWAVGTGAEFSASLTLGLPVVAMGAALARYKNRESTLLMGAGLILSVAVYSLCRMFLLFDDTTFSTGFVMMTLVFEGLFCSLVRDIDTPALSARDDIPRVRDALSSIPLLENRGVRWSFITLVLLYFAGYGILETFALYLHGDSYPFSPLLFLLTAAAIVAIVIADRKRSLATWCMVLICSVVMAYLCCLLAAVFLDDLPSSLFAIIYTTTIVMHVAVWTTLLRLSDGNTSTAVVLFSLVTGVLYAFQMGGHLIINVLMSGFGVRMPQVSLLSTAVLTGLALLIGALMLVQLNAANKRLTTVIADPSPAESDAYTALGAAFQLSERECTVMRLYASGRSVPAISEQLNLAQPTVRTYIQRVYNKLDVHDKQQLLDAVDKFRGVAAR